MKKQLNNINHWIIDVLNEMSNHKMSIIFVFILFLLLWIVPQINDLIVVLNQAQNDWFVVFTFFASLSVLAFLISTVDSYFNPPIPSSDEESDLKPSEDAAPIQQQQNQSLFQIPKDSKERYLEQRRDDTLTTDVLDDFYETQAQYIKRLFPKILGTILILIAAFAVSNTFYEIYDETILITPKLGLGICIFLLFLLLNQSLILKCSRWLHKFPWTNYIPIVVALFCFFGIIILGLLNTGGSREDTLRFFTALLLLAILFLLISVSYNMFVLKLKRRLGAKLILGLTIIAFIAYIYLVFNPEGLAYITPLSIVMICVIGMFTILNLIKLVGHRYNIPLLPIVLIISVALAVYTANKPDFSHYDASWKKTAIMSSERLVLDVFINEWIDDRKAEILTHDSSNPFPIIMVSSEGGGSRAGLWSFLVQSYLYERNPDYFEIYLFSITGASGGGVGNNMFYTQAYQLQEGTSIVPFKFKTAEADELQYRASCIYKKDYLSTSVASLMGRDLFKSITNIGVFQDRGKLLENQWESAFAETFKYSETNQSPLAETYLEMMPHLGSGIIKPLLITNTTHLQSGKRAVISPVAIDRDSHNMGVFMDLLAKYPFKNRMIKRSTAMSLNARFPYISPAARIKKLGQFGDAGYYDNVGGTVTRRLTVALEKALAERDTLKGKYEIKHLVIKNYAKAWDVDGILNYSSQLTAPAGMIWNATFAHPTEMEKTFTNVSYIESKRTDIEERKAVLSFSTEDDANGLMKPIIPLGRYLSEAAVRSLEKRLENDTIIEKLNMILPSK
ncbi:hypothetical protein A9Q87_12605 [Flavobacteriales bacterium 34_180_T64]|nr:hypothetical protein A9Q87_12605 [Flavobacteriales bacterium 34_180_T64]